MMISKVVSFIVIVRMHVSKLKFYADVTTRVWRGADPVLILKETELNLKIHLDKSVRFLI